MKRNTFFSLCALLLLNVAFTLATAPAQPCDTQKCNLPSCRCSGSDIPGGLARDKIPQLVFLSFDAAVSRDNFAFYQDVLFNRKNPNNQSITVTFFASHSDTNYSMLHDLYRRGHEVALNSISVNTSQDYWKSLNATGWRNELLDQREQMNVFARIPSSEIKGVRAPQLICGGDEMYEALRQARIQYDSSMPTEKFRVSGLWPYTNDYQSTQDCVIPHAKCPTEQHAGFWTVPMISYEGSDGEPCSMADQCTPVPMKEDDTYNLLMNNFQTHYTNHRAPFGVFVRHGWVNGTANPGDDQIWQRRLGYIRFLDYLDSLNDVYIVSIARGLQWVQTPKALSEVANFSHFQVAPKPDLCRQSFSCEYRAGQHPFKPPLAQERMFHSCVPCPLAYPWVGNHLGRNPYQ